MDAAGPGRARGISGTRTDGEFSIRNGTERSTLDTIEDGLNDFSLAIFGTSVRIGVGPVPSESLHESFDTPILSLVLVPDSWEIDWIELIILVEDPRPAAGACVGGCMVSIKNAFTGGFGSSAGDSESFHTTISFDCCSVSERSVSG
jgi:hypothetical protein